jgi:hypothetical protein
MRAQPGDGTSPERTQHRSARPLGITSLRDSSADGETRRVAAAILEVLAGERTPRDCAEALGVSLPRYYALEARALGGFIEACRKRPKGRRRRPEREIERLEREVARLERDCARGQSLLRLAQKAVGLAAPRKDRAAGGKASGSSTKARRRKRPKRRALRAAALLREAAGGEKTVDSSGGGVNNEGAKME